jgi:hypothetical protein
MKLKTILIIILISLFAIDNFILTPFALTFANGLTEANCFHHQNYLLWGIKYFYISTPFICVLIFILYKGYETILLNLNLKYKNEIIILVLMLQLGLFLYTDINNLLLIIKNM